MDTKVNNRLLVFFIYCVLLMTGVLYPCININAQKVVNRSEKKRPLWLSNAVPKPSNPTFIYQITETTHESMDDARASSIIQLSTFIKDQNFNITAQGDGLIEFSQKDGNASETESYLFDYKIDGKKVSFISNKYDEYWEYIEFPDGKRKYRLYTLYGYAKTGNVRFDELNFSYKYGMRGFCRSMIVPGWGQFYKHSKTKGALILSGTVGLAGGIIATENMRASYTKKMKETTNSSSIRTYNSKADNLETARNVCIGGLVALYVYNLIDAAVAPGAKRTSVVKNKKNKHYTLVMPTVSHEMSGIALSYNF